MDDYPSRSDRPVQTFTGMQIQQWIARGSENLRAYLPRTSVWVNDDSPDEDGDAWVFTNGEKDEYGQEKVFQLALPFTEELDPAKEYVCRQMVAYEAVSTEYDEADGWGDATHVTRCDHCGTHTQLNKLHVKSRCGSCTGGYN